MNKAVIFGAGNIGRSFIGSIFASNGWEVTFIDANGPLVDELNRRGGYPILIKRSGRKDEELRITGINAVHSSDSPAVLDALTECTLCSTSVGQGALRFVVPQIADAVKKRMTEGKDPLDVIIAENIRNGAEYFRTFFREAGLDGGEAGLVETSIGKMVPIMSSEDLKEDPLVLHAEEYNTLILDERGFKNGVPELPQIKAVSNITAWVDRKLFIHNMGHAAAAYFGYEKHPDMKLIAEVVGDEEIHGKVASAMRQSAAALLKEYPDDFTAAALQEHIDDLLFRFGNAALGDTVFRVGRDLYRKLSREDRILGAAALCIRHGLPFDSILDIFRAGLQFRAAAEDGSMFEPDTGFHSALETGGLEAMLAGDLGLNPDDGRLRQEILRLVQ